MPQTLPIFFLFISLLNSTLFFTSISAQNLVPNHSFEDLKIDVPRWSTNNDNFEARIETWTSPNWGSPDILTREFVSKMIPPRKNVNIGIHQPRTGNVMIGIKVHGCATYTQHCKEYVQIELSEPLIEGQEYHIEFWANAMSTSIHTNNLGVVFTDVEIEDENEYGIYYFNTVVNETKLINQPPNDWLKIEGNYTPDQDYNYIIVGNFFDDASTEMVRDPGNIRYGYYLIDDISVTPVVQLEEIEQVEFEIGKTVRLNNVFFEFNQTEILPTSYDELNKMVARLKANPSCNIMIQGHTDNVGDELANYNLSEQRASAVMNYLIEKKVSPEQLDYQGYGEAKAIAGNDTEEGRQLNRRVEFLVVKN